MIHPATAIELFVHHALQKPHATAVIDGNSEISYSDLLQRSQQAAHNLKKRGIKKGDIIALETKQTADLVAVILGSMLAGVTYVPIDKNFPASRKKMVLENCNAVLIVGDSPLSGIHSTSATELTQGLLIQPLEITDRYPCSNDPVYIIYTSGTTGKPKGVRISHGSLYNYITWAKNTYLQENRHYYFPLFTSLAFDLSVTALLLPLISGNTMIIHDEENSVQSLLQAFSDPRVNIIKCTPSQLNYIDSIAEYSKIETIIVGGENLSTRKAFEISQRLDHKVSIFNEYGPTETTVGCTCHQYDPNRDTQAYVPLGKPIDNTILFMVNQQGDTISGVGKGELYIGGAGLALGYLNAKAQTNKKFISFQTRETHVRVYKTGDLVSRDKDGNIFFGGRMDDQVKIGGYRVELQEIESAILKHPQTEQAVVFTDENNMLYACIKCKPEKNLTTDEIKEHLREYLPYWMIPGHFYFTMEFPVTPHGKTDKEKLRKELVVQRKISNQALSEKLPKIFSVVLDIGNIKPDDNFFSLGGDSLKAMQAINMIRNETGYDLSIIDLFHTPTIRGVEMRLQKAEDASQPSTFDQKQEGKYLPVSESQYQIFTDLQFAPHILRYNLTTAWHFDSVLDGKRLKHAITKVVERHESLRTGFQWDKGKLIGVLRSDLPDFEEIHVTETERVAELISSFPKPFDLATPPLIRASLIIINNNKSTLLLDKHHIAVDGLSEQTLIEDICAFYEGKTPEMPAIRFTDHVRRQQTQSALHEKDLQIFWTNYLKGVKPRPVLPLDSTRPESPSPEGDYIIGIIDRETVTLLKRFSRYQNTTIFTVLFVVYYQLLKNYTRQEDITIVTYAAGRSLHSLQNTIGMFVNTIPVRIKKCDAAFKKQLLTIRETLGAALQHQDYPYRKILKTAFRDHNHVTTPLFNVSIAYHDYLIRKFEIDGVSAVVAQIKHHSTVTDLTLDISLCDGQLIIDWIYNKDVVARATVESLHENFTAMLRELLETGKLNDISDASGKKIRQRKIDAAEMRPLPDKEILPNTPLLPAVTRLFRQHTGNKEVFPSADFFKSGGDSLSFISFLHQLYIETGNKLLPAHAILNPTPAGIVKIMESALRNNNNLGTWLSNGNEKSVICFPPALGNALTFREFANRLDHYNIYAFDFIDHDNLITRYADEIIHNCAGKPLFLLGYSGGGNLAFETAKVLEARGGKIDGLILIDSFRKKNKIQQFPQAIERFKQNLKTSMSTGSAPEKTISESVDAYYAFINFALEDHRGLIHPDIHLIASEDRDIFAGIKTDLGAPYFSSWKKATAGKFYEYAAKGSHQQLLQGPHLSQTLRILNHILAGKNKITSKP